MDGSRRVVRVVVPASDVEVAIDVLWQADPSAVAEEARPDGCVALIADPRTSGVLDALPPSARLELVEVDERDLDVWRAWAVPVRVGRRIVLHPAWLPAPPPTDGAVVVELDPGRSFGTGSHPSTRLVAAAMEDYVSPGARVLDVGAGSGVLSVLAARLGAASVVAIDVDADAVTTTSSNARRNGVADVVEASTRPLREVRGAFDLVVANIGAGVLRELAGALVARVAVAGHLVLSGLLAEQVDLTVAAFGDLTEVERRGEQGWVAVVLRAPLTSLSSAAGA